MEFLDRLMVLIHEVYHPVDKFEIVDEIGIFLYVWQLTQELSLIQDDQSTFTFDTQTIYELDNYTFYFNSITANQQIVLIIMWFVFGLLVLLTYGVLVYQKHPSRAIQNTLKYVQLVFYFIGTIPMIYGNFKFIVDSSLCEMSTYCTGNYTIFILLCLFNIIISLVLLAIQSYFQRADSIQESSGHLILNYSPFYELVEKILLIVIIILNVFNIQLTIQRVILIIYQLWRILSRLYKIQAENQMKLIIDSIQFILSCSIIFTLSLYEILIVIPLAITTILTLQRYLITKYTLTSSQVNLPTIQLLNYYILEGKHISGVQISAMMKQHICNKCKKPSHMIQCLLKQKVKESNQSEFLLLYCTYLSRNSPLKALMKLIAIDKNYSNHYFLYARTNIIKRLYEKVQMKESIMINRLQIKSSDHVAILDLSTVFESMRTPQIMFETFLSVIESKITFWHYLINGCQNIDSCIEQTLETTKLMLECKSKMNQRFDLQNNRLKHSQMVDIQTLRIIQIFHSAIYANSVIAFQNEKDIEEILKSERFKQDESLDNMQLIQNRILTLKSSFIKNRGELVALNRSQVSLFLSTPEEELRNFKHVNQIMPSFLANVHDKLMDNYVQKGYSKLVIKGEETYIQNFNGYIESCVIHQYNEHFNMDDFIVNMIVTKEQSINDQILFGMDGRILGISKRFYEFQANQSKDNYSKLLSINYVIKQGAIIQFYLPDIIRSITDLKTSIQEQSNYILNNQVGQWNIPSNLYECLQTSPIIFQQFRKRSEGQNSASLSRFSQMTIVQKSIQSKTCEILDLSQNMQVELKYGNDILLLMHPEVQSQILELIDENKNTNNTSSINIVYQLHYRTLDYKNGSQGYFALTIKEMKALEKLEGTSFATNVKTIITPSSQDSFSHHVQTIQPEAESSQGFRQNINVMEIHENAKLKQNIEEQIQKSISQRKNLVSRIDETNRINESQRVMLQQTTFIYPKQHRQFIEDDQLQIENEMKQLEFDQEERSQEDLGAPQNNSNSRSKNNSDIYQKMKKLQSMKKQEHAEGESVDSKISSTSTSKESLVIVQQLYLSQKIVNPLSRITCLLVLIGSGIFTSVILNVYLISSNLDDQTSQINVILLPQDLNYGFSSLYVQFSSKILYQLGLQEQSPFLYWWNDQQFPVMLKYESSKIHISGIEIAILAQSLNYQSFNSSYVDLSGSIKYDLISYHQLYERWYEEFKSIYLNNMNLSLNQQNFKKFGTQYFLRQNIVKVIQFHDQLIQSIMKSTISNQNDVPQEFLTIMFLEMFSVILIIGIQLRSWIILDHIKRSIIFLVSRLNETQAIEQITKLTILKSSIVDYNSNNWKSQDFTQIMFMSHEINESTNQTSKIKAKLNLNSNSYKATSSLYSRIQQNNYLNRVNVMITFIIAILWCVLLMTGYLIHMNKNTQFQPSLTAALSYVRFRHSFDTSVQLATIIKSEILTQQYNNNNLSLINQTETILVFQELYTSILPTINEILTVIEQSAQRLGKTSIFDPILTQDLCPQLPSLLVMCNASTLPSITSSDLEFYTSELYAIYLSKGTIGYCQYFVNFIETEFVYELQNYAYQPDINKTKTLVRSAFFKILTLQYYLDTQNAFQQIVSLFQTDNTNIAQSIKSIVSAYYYAAGFILVLAFIITSVIWVYKAQKNINQLAQILVLIPVENLLTSNFKSHTKDIYAQLYE